MRLPRTWERAFPEQVLAVLITLCRFPSSATLLWARGTRLEGPLSVSSAHAVGCQKRMEVKSVKCVMAFHSTTGSYRNGFNNNEGTSPGVTGKRRWRERGVSVTAPWLCPPLSAEGGGRWSDPARAASGAGGRPWASLERQPGRS